MQAGPAVEPLRRSPAEGHMKSRTSIGLAFLAFPLTLLLFVAQLGAQEGDAANAQAKQEKVAAVKQSLAQNQAALKSYSWTETTQISLKGEVKKEEQKQCQYGADGKVQKTPIENPASSQTSQQQSGTGRRGGR